MTREEVQKLIIYLGTAYPNCFGENITGTIDVWFDAFKEVEPAIMNVAAKNFVKASKFAPTVAGIQEQIDLIYDDDNGTDLWAMIHKAISNSSYHSKEEFEKLPAECKSFVGSPAALKDMAMCESGVVNTVVKGQFLKQIPNIKAHKKVQEGLPLEVRQAITDSKQRMLIGD